MSKLVNIICTKEISFILFFMFFSTISNAGITEQIQKSHDIANKEKPIIDLNPITDKAKIVFIRLSRFAVSGLAARIKINGNDVKHINSGDVFVHTVEQGKHIVSCTAFLTPGKFTVEIDTKKNNVYFIQIEPRGSAVFAGVVFGVIGSVIEGGGSFSLFPISSGLATNTLDKLGFKYDKNKLIIKTEEDKRVGSD